MRSPYMPPPMTNEMQMKVINKVQNQLIEGSYILGSTGNSGPTGVVVSFLSMTGGVTMSVVSFLTTTGGVTGGLVSFFAGGVTISGVVWFVTVVLVCESVGVLVSPPAV